MVFAIFEYIRDNDDVIKAVVHINTDWDAQPMWAKPYHQGYWGIHEYRAIR
jgi:hypothetical protein